MTGSRRSALRLAMPALLLALLVGVRAISLCCLDVSWSQANDTRHATHESKPHHGPEREAAPVGPGLALLATSACVLLATPAPALRERGRAGDGAPGAGDLALAPTPGVGHPHPPGRRARLWLTTFPRPAGAAEFPQPLRL